MNNTVCKIAACAMSLMLAASMLSACEGSGEGAKKSSGNLSAKQMLINALESKTSTAKNSLSLLSNSSSDIKSGAKAEITIDPGEYLDELAGSDIKEISFAVDAKVKGGIIGSGLDFGYDGESLAGIDTVIDSETQEAYIKIADLSDKYIKVPVSDYVGYFLPDYEYVSDVDSSDILSMYEYQADQVTKALDKVDISGIVSDVDEVVDAIDKALPEAEKSDEKTVKENGIQAVFETKKPSITDEDVKKCAEAAKDALLKSENIKAVVSQDVYEELIENMFEPYDKYDEYDGAEEYDEPDDLVFFYYGGKLSGFGVDDKNYLVSADTDDGYMFVFKTDSEDNKGEVVLTAAADGDKLDISFIVSVNDGMALSSVSGNEIIVKINDFEIVNEDIGSYNAQIEADMSISVDESAQPVQCVIKAKCEGDDRTQKESGEILVEESGKSKELLSYKLSYEQTDASDIKIPSDSECLTDDDIASQFSEDKLNEWRDKISKAIGIDLSTLNDELSELESYIYGDSYEIDYDDDPLYDLMDNYDIDFSDYYNDDNTEFDMDGFLADAKEVYPADKMDALKEQIEEEYPYYISTPNLDELYDDYDVDYWDYYNDNYTEFDMDKFLADAKKVYPADKMDALKKEIEEVYQCPLSDTPNLDTLYDDYDIDYWDYYNDDFSEFDIDKFLADAKEVYPTEKMDDLKKEVESEVYDE